jgi:prephenate dehydrogenase
MIRIAIIGMGLIGTALGISLRSADSKKDPMGELEVIGYDANTDHLKEARARLAIDKMAPSMADAVKGAHLVVLAVPALALREVLATIAPSLEPGAVVTDVTSTKGQVAAWAQELLAPSNPFVGGHPMAGREQSGPKAAVHDLFKSAVYCLCPSVNSPPEAIALCEAMVERVGAKAYFIDPVEHDAYVAGISHMPFVMASLLVHVTSQASSWREMAALAAGGYRDTTRLASGDVTMHRDIIMTNAEAINRWIDVCIDELQGLKSEIASGNQVAVQEYLQRTKQARDEWLKHKPGMRPGEAEYEDMGMGMVERPSLFGRRSGGRSS